MVSIFLHIYYPESIPEMLVALRRLDIKNLKLYINIVDTSPIDPAIFNTCSNAIIFTSTNQGKDIGGKLVMLDSFISTEDENTYIVLLHDKKSMHSATGNFWQKKLFSIIEKEQIEKIITLFEKNNDISVVAQSRFIKTEWNKNRKQFDSVNNAILQELLNTYDLKPAHYEFVAGTMFWVRAKHFIPFFKKNPPLSIRQTLEKGNVLDHTAGTYAHSWERMLSWIPCSSGTKITGVE